MDPNGYRGPVSNRRRTRTIITIVTLFSLIGVVAGLIFFFIGRQGGERGKAESTPTAGTTRTIINNPTPDNPGTGKCTSDSPYGFTTIHADTQLVTFYKQLNICWVRYQFHWDKIETSPGVYDWSQVDAAIATMNAASIHVDFAIQKVPDWHMTQTCHGVPFRAGSAEMAQFTTQLAARYDGEHGHGQIEAFEIGNEEYDNYFVRGDSSSLECRSASYYGPVLKAGYQAIKAVNPHALVGMFGMWYHNEPHIRDFMTYLFKNGYGPYMDYMNFHYYNSGADPTVTRGNNPSFDLWWQTMHDIAAQYGYPNKPIWVTEVGWSAVDISPQMQSQYLQYIMNEAAKSGVIKKVFWFTINYGQQAFNLYPPMGPLPAFFTYQAMIRQKQIWN